MRIILNSDVLYTTRPLQRSLPKHLGDAFRNAGDLDVRIVIPRTVLLEVERHQSDLRRSECAELDLAGKRLLEYGVAVPAFDSAELLKAQSLLDLVRRTGVVAVEVEPTYEDYRNAERRACLHLPPCPQTGAKGGTGTRAASSDEMRDLVIWELSLRIAKEEGGAILHSRDRVHTGDHSLTEAATVGLAVAKTVDEVIDRLGQATPAATKARELLGFVWSELLEAQFPLPEKETNARISRSAFKVDASGHLSGSFEFTIQGPEGPLSANADIFEPAPEQVRVVLENVSVADAPRNDLSNTFQVSGSLPVFASPAEERLRELRTTLEDSE